MCKVHCYFHSNLVYESKGHILHLAADAGQEHGYLVKMTDDSLAIPYTMQPGQKVTLVSRYDSSVDHYGVMAFVIPWLANFDPTCPGNATGPTPHENLLYQIGGYPSLTVALLIMIMWSSRLLSMHACNAIVPCNATGGSVI